MAHTHSHTLTHTHTVATVPLGGGTHTLTHTHAHSYRSHRPTRRWLLSLLWEDTTSEATRLVVSSHESGRRPRRATTTSLSCGLLPVATVDWDHGYCPSSHSSQSSPPPSRRLVESALGGAVATGRSSSHGSCAVKRFVMCFVGMSCVLLEILAIVISVTFSGTGRRGTSRWKGRGKPLMH